MDEDVDNLENPLLSGEEEGFAGPSLRRHGPFTLSSSPHSPSPSPSHSHSLAFSHTPRGHSMVLAPAIGTRGLRFHTQSEEYLAALEDTGGDAGEEEKGLHSQPDGMNCRVFFYSFFWTVLFALLAGALAFWVPDYYVFDLDLAPFALNVTGSLIIGLTTLFLQIPGQYEQTYLMYAAISGGFCSVWTSFGNFVESSDTLLYLYLGPLKCLINIFGTLSVAFALNLLGRYIALWWKVDARYASQLMKMENAQYHMQMQLEMEIAQEGDVMTINQGEEKVVVKDVLQSLDRVRKKEERHKTLRLTGRHYLIVGLIFVVVVGSYAAIRLSSTVLMSSSIATSKEVEEFDFFVTLFWSVTGALAGSWLGSQADASKRGVQWGTFHVNMLSCILIGIAHNVLLLREFFPYGDSIYFAIVVQRFITSFCGSESSFAGLVDETAQLYNSHCPRKIVIRNLFYNLFVCMVVFLAIVFTVRFAFFYSVYY